LAKIPPTSKTPNRLDAFANLLGNGSQPYKYIPSEIEIFSIIVLPQPRQKFENIPELGNDLAQKGLLHPPTIAEFTENGFWQYLRTINQLWGTRFRLKQFRSQTIKGRNRYYVLLAGERRLRACKYLWETGCEVCRETNFKLKPGECFRKHFRKEKIRINLCRGISALPALFLQLSENTHMAIPPEDEAYVYDMLFRLIKGINTTYTLKHFALQVGRSPQTVSNALRYCRLPASIQRAVKTGLIPYGIAIELARLQQNGETLAQIKSWWFKNALVKNYKVTDFHGLVSKHLRNLNSGQIELLGIFEAEQLKARQKARIRATVEKNCIRALWVELHYIRNVIKLFQQGLLGLPDSPFSERSPLRVFEALIAQLEILHGHLQKILKQKSWQKAQKQIFKADAITQQLLAALPKFENHHSKLKRSSLNKS
jgi:hypothetical protein